MSPRPEADGGTAAASASPQPQSSTPPGSKSPSPPDQPPPPPDPATDAHFCADEHTQTTSPPLSSPRTEQQLLDELDDDIFSIPPAAAMRLLGSGIEALVQSTGDIPPSPAPERPEAPRMRGMEAEKQDIVRSHSARTLVRLRLEAEAKAQRAAEARENSRAAAQQEGRCIDGVMLRDAPPGTSSGGEGGAHPPPSTPEPYTVVGDNAQPVNVQHSVITRKFYSKKPPPIGIADYLARLHRFCPASTGVYLATSLYLHRLAVDERAIAVTRRNAHRLLLAGLRVANKALEDRCYSHRRFAQVGGVTASELARLEISFCFLASFELVVNQDEMRSHWNVMRKPPDPRMSPSGSGFLLGGGYIEDGSQTAAAEVDDGGGGGLEMNLSRRPKAASGDSERRYFYYLTGCELPDCYFTYDIATSRSTLYIPPVDPESVIWSGLPMSASEALQKYDVDEVRYTHEVNAALTSLAEAASSSTVYAIPNQVSDSITFLGFGAKNFDVLKPAIERARVVKTDYEVALIAKANEISSAAHLAVLKRVRHVSNERELYATFLAECISRGAPHMAYHSIVAAGRAAATLHYVKNDEPTAGKLNLLLDAACELNCYASDITRTFPISGSFTPESRAIYDTVLRMQLETLAMLKEGVRWDDVHVHAHRVAIEGLLAAGIFKKGFSVDEILESRTSVAFFPHGLGHYLGMDTHDTGGNANYQDKDSMFRYLRVRGTLPAGSVITVEPGIYFCNFIIEPYLKDEKHSKYIDAAVLDKYWDVGGVRIEDNVVITKDGYDNLTTAVKDAQEMEKIISSS
ncbi:hypothetical protein PpBr36_02541 [Pyricularia pennisetigena]|uniref:hypothetical protein n=1 Tax=Pyricularia pennisetigena TaxID=1578925 RepID=UPI001154C0FA|nr:hypothetical protein PpBr36_02541 [Pyricularia pennisetigena]TLS30768.1 hypothetical protein PpBr36_02541 [Pyricularia pennisetigena]